MPEVTNMSVDITLWKDLPQKQVPAFRCPTCNKGTLAPVKDGLRMTEFGLSKRARGHNDWEPEWVEQRFSLLLACTVATCRELVVVSGDTVVEEEDDEEFGRAWASHLRPRSMYPAPYVIEVADEVPKAVVNELQQSFQLFWADLNAAANRMRTSLERALDVLGVKKYNRTGRRVSLPLAQRIALFEREHGGEFFCNLHGPCHVGNLVRIRILANGVADGLRAVRARPVRAVRQEEKKLAAMSKKLIKSKGKMK